MHTGDNILSLSDKESNKRDILLSLLLRRLCAEADWGQYIGPFVYTDSEWTGQYSVPFGVFALFFRCGQDNVLFVLCGNAGKCTGNADNIGYGNGVYVWRIGGTGTLIWYVDDVCVGRIGGIIREMGGLYQLFQCFSAIFYPEGQLSLKDPVICRYRSLCV